MIRSRNRARGGKNMALPSQLTVHQGGQSLGEYYFLRGNPIVSVQFVDWLRTEMGYSTAGTIVNHTAGLPYVTTDATTKTGSDFKVRYVNGASGGSNLVDVSVTGNIATGNYWYNTQDNSATSPGGVLDATPNSAGPLWRAAVSYISTYGCDVYLWSQGQAEVTYVTTAANATTYENTLRLFISAMRTAAGKPNMPFVFQHICRNNVYTDSGLQIISEIQTRISNDTANVYVGTEEYFASFAAASAINSCSTTLGSAVISTVNTSAVSANMNIQGPGIPDNSYVVSVAAGVSITLDKNATATASGVTLYRMDDTHPYPSSISGLDTDTQQGFFSISRRLTRPVKEILLGTPKKSFGPYISAISPAYGSNYVDITIAHDKGTDLTTVNGAISSLSKSFFRVENNGSAMTITNVARLNATTLRLTLSVALTDGTVYVWSAYGAMNKTDWRDIVIDDSSTKMPLQRQSPALVSALRSYTNTGRTDLQSAGFSNVVAQWDATLSGSYNGFDTYLRNLTTTPVDGSSKAAYDLRINNMTFTGTAGLSSAKFVSVGTSSFFEIDANTTFLNSLHKTIAGQPSQAHTLIMVFKTPNVTTSAYLMSTFNSTTEAGYAVNFNAGALATRQRGDTASVVVASGAVAINTTYLYIESKSAGGTGYSYWVNTRTGTVTTLTFNASTTDSSTNFHIFSRSDAGQGPIANSEFKGAALLNIYCNDTLAGQIADYYNTLHGATYA